MKEIKKGSILVLILLIFIISVVPVGAATNKPLQSIKLNSTSQIINKGEVINLRVTYVPADTTDSKRIIWTSSNSNIAYVSAGKVKGISPGTATITAKCGTKTATFKVTVKAPITQMTFSVTNKTITAGDGFGITTTYSPANTTDSKTIIWTSSNTKVATVKNGYVTGLNAGTTTITGKMGTKTATCKVTVKARTVKLADCYTELNNYRKKTGVKTLTKDAQLEKIAQLRAQEIQKLFDHKTYYTYKNKKFVKGKSLRSPTDLIKEVKGNVYRGENIAYGQKTPKEVTAAWYKSAGHKKNMLNKHFTKVGIAYYIYNGTVYWVQIFSS